MLRQKKIPKPFDESTRERSRRCYEFRALHNSNIYTFVKKITATVFYAFRFLFLILLIFAAPIHTQRLPFADNFDFGLWNGLQWMWLHRLEQSFWWNIRNQTKHYQYCAPPRKTNEQNPNPKCVSRRNYFRDHV